MFQRLLGNLIQRLVPILKGTTAAVPTRQNPVAVNQLIKYPPQDPGFTLVSVENLLTVQKPIIDLLRGHAALSNELFMSRFGDPIRNLAQLIGNIPGSASGVFGGEGGLFRACLEMGFYCFRGSDGRIFTGSSGVEERHLLENRWRYVCFCAGLMYPVGATLDGLSLVDHGGKAWSPELDTLHDVIGVGEQYWVTWRKNSCEPGPAALSGMLAARILGRTNIDWLNQGSPELFRKIIDITTGSPNVKGLIANDLIKELWSGVHEREMARRHQNYGLLVVGSHISPYIIDAMLSLKESHWVVNEKTLFADKDGVYIQWPAGGTDILNFCKNKDYRGIPNTENALLTMMAGNDIVESNFDGISITEIADKNGEIVCAVKLTKPGMLVENLSVYSKPESKILSIAKIVASDPLAASAPDEAAEKPMPKKKKESSKSGDEKPSPTLDMLEIGAGEPVDDMATSSSSSEVDETTEKTELVQNIPEPLPIPKASPKAEKNESAGNSPSSQFKEGVAINYADLVPKDIRDQLKPHSNEILGKVISSWKTAGDEVMFKRITKFGAAIENEFILKTSTRALDAILEWSSIGLLYIDPSRSGVKVHQISEVEGGAKKISCIIFSKSMTARFGLK
jgi:hypothetical protein